MLLENIPVGYLALLLCVITVAVQMVVEKTYAMFERQQIKKQTRGKIKGGS